MMKTKTERASKRMGCLLTLAICVSLGMSSCGTVAEPVAAPSGQCVRSGGVSSLPKDVADAGLTAIAYPLGAAGLLIMDAMFLTAPLYGGPFMPSPTLEYLSGL